MGQREEEKAAQIIAALAADMDGVMIRGTKAIKRLEALDAQPNLVVAARRALETLNEVARALRRDGLLPERQQRLL
jgi:ribonucleotide monophosphatase NagD (HAD superfamily)